MRALKVLVLAGALAGGLSAAAQTSAAATPDVTVGSQYSTTHVYVPPADFDRFVTSFVATFGGRAARQAVVTVTPTPSRTLFEPVQTPVGNLSAFGFETPVPYPFGSERTGYLVTDIDTAVQAARDNGAAVIVSPFPDPIGRDAIIQWPGGVNMPLYWHTKPPSPEPPLLAAPENRVYVSRDNADTFIRDFVTFSHGAVTSDAAGRPGRRNRTRRRAVPPRPHRIRIRQGRRAGHGRTPALALWTRACRIRSLERPGYACEGDRGWGQNSGGAVHGGSAGFSDGRVPRRLYRGDSRGGPALSAREPQPRSAPGAALVVREGKSA